MKTFLFVPVLIILGACSSPSKYDKQRMEIQKQEARERIDSVDINKGDEIQMKDTMFGNEQITIKKKN